MPFRHDLQRDVLRHATLRAKRANGKNSYFVSQALHKNHVKSTCFKLGVFTPCRMIIHRFMHDKDQHSIDQSGVSAASLTPGYFLLPNEPKR